MGDAMADDSYRQPAPPPAPEPSCTIRITPKGINALMIVEENRYAELSWWQKLLQYRAHKKKLNDYRPCGKR